MFFYRRILTISTVFFLILVLINHDEAQGQGFYRPKTRKYSALSVGVGTTHFQGDLSPVNTFKSLTTSVRWNINISYKYTVNSKIHVGASAAFIRIAGDDFFADNDENFIRNLHFRNDVKQLGAFVEIHPFEYTTDFRKRLNLSPYFTTGINYFFHSPQAKLPANFGSKIWRNIEPYHTEGQGVNMIYPEPYSLSGISIPLGLGIRYKFNNTIDLAFEATYHHTYNDYLDDVSGIYPNTALFSDQLGSAFSNRSREQIATNVGTDRTTRVVEYLSKNQLPTSSPFNSTSPLFGAIGTDRGSRVGNDSFITTSLKVNILLPDKRIFCPKLR